MASSDPVPEVNKVIVSVGHRRGEGPAASCKKKKRKGSKHKERRAEKERKRKRQGPQRPLPTYNWRDHCLLTTPGTTEKRKEQAEQASIFVDFQRFSTIFNDLQ